MKPPTPSLQPLEPEPALFAPGAGERLAAQLRFILEADRLKHVIRRSMLVDQSRRENTAEHSWHIALVALALREYSPVPVNMERVLTMLILHDLVEIEAGDSFVYDPAAMADKDARERLAADKVFGLLPPDLAGEFRAAWEEFEARATPESRFAAAVDRLMPMLHNYATRGCAWVELGIRRSQVLGYNSHIADGAPDLWEYARAMVEDAVRRGWLVDA